MNYSTSATNLHDQIAISADKNSWSKKVTKRRRRSVAKDQKAIAITRISAPVVISAAAAPLVSNPTSPKSPLLTPLTTDSSIPANDDHSDTRKGEKAGEKSAPVHCWAHTTDTAKVTAANRVLEAAGKGYAFTLNLSPTEIAAANDNRKGFSDYFKRRISRALNHTLGYAPDYLFGVGVAARDRLHLHGTIEANDNELDAIKAALEHAGGTWEHGRGSEYQCQMEPLYTPDVWSAYCFRDGPKARRLIKGRAVSITTPLRGRAKELWASL